MNKKKLLALLMALVMTLTLVPVTAFAEGESAVETSISMTDFISAIENVESYDGKNVTVTFDPSTDTGSNFHHVSDGYQIYFLGSYGENVRKTPIAIKNVNFVTDSDSDDKSQLYAYTTKDVTFEGCTFENMGISMHGVEDKNPDSNAKLTVKDCSFSNLDEYAIKYVKNAEITGCNFTNCERAVMAACNQNSASKDTAVDSLIISGNSFNGMTKNRIIKLYNLKTDDESIINVTNNTIDSSSTAALFQVKNDGNVNSDCHYKILGTGNTGVKGLYDSDGIRLYVDGDYYTDIEPQASTSVAKIGTTEYATLQAAIDAAPNGEETTITLLKDVTDGSGIMTPDSGDGTNKNIIIDFAGYSYTMKDPAVGSTGTETQAMHFGSGTVTMKDGTFTVKNGAENVKMGLQNYANLTLENMTIDLTNVVTQTYGEYTGQYAVWSHKQVPIFNFNKGTVVIKDTTVTANEGALFNVNLGDGTQFTNVTIESGTFGGAFIVEGTSKQQGSFVVKGGAFASNPEQTLSMDDGQRYNYVAEGYEAVNTNSTWTVEKKKVYVAEVYDGDVKKDEFESLAEAFTFAQNNNYRDVVLVNNVTVESPISIADEAEICLNIGNHTITAKTTEARPFVLNEDSSLTVNAESNGGMIIPETETNVYGFFRVQGAGAELVLNGGGYTNSSTDANAMIRVLNNGNTLTHSVRIEMNDLAVSGIQIIRDDTCAGHPNYAQYGDLSNKLAVNGGSYVLHNNGINVGGSITGFVLQYVDSSFTNVTMTSDIGACVELDGGKAQFVGNSFAVNNANSIQGWNATTIGISYNAEATIKSGTYTSARDGIAIFSHGGRYVIEGGNITGNSSSIKTYYQDGSYSVAISGGNLKGALDFESHTVGSLTGGFYSVEPNEALVAAPYAVVASGISEYPWTIGVKLNENTTVTQDSISSVTVSDTIVPDTTMRDAIISNTTVSGVELTLTETVGTGDDAKSGLQAVIDAAKNDEDFSTKLSTASKVEIKVDVKVTPKTFSEEAVTFKLTPIATVKTYTDETDTTPSSTVTDIAVENDWIDQSQPITVQLYTNFLPSQIIHRDNDGNVIEVFTGNQIVYDATTGVATVTISHFSELEAVQYVAQIGDNKYATLKAAFDAAGNNDTIKLLADISLTERLFVNAGANPEYAGANNRYATTSEDKAITLDMNGHNIQSSSNIALAGGSLAITGTGKISTSASGLAPIEIRGTGDLTSKRTLTIDSGVTLEGEEYGLNVFGSNNGDKNLIDVTVNGTVNGTLFVLGNLTNTANEINIVVNGTVNGGNEEVGIALNGYGNVTVNGGANVSGKTGIEVRAGKLTVNGGTITGKGAYAAPTHNGSGTTSSGAAVAVAQHSTKLPIDVTLTGGTLSATGANGKAVVVADPEGNETIAESVQVVATESFKNNSAVDEDYEWVVTSGNNYTLQEKPVKALGGSLRRRATNGGNGNIVYDETDLRFGFTVTDAGHFSTVDSYFTYTFGDYTSGHITATKIANDGTTNLVLTKVPANYFNTEITVTLHAFDIYGEEIGTVALTKSVKEVAFALRDGGENISQTWKNYAGEIISINSLTK